MDHPNPDDRDNAVKWARRALRREFVILDFETSGLDNKAEAVEVGLLSHTGEVLIDMRVKPTCPISAGAYQVHGISSDMVRGAPPFAQAASGLEGHMRNKLVIVYNVDYDRGILGHCLSVMGMSAKDIANRIGRSLWHCAMEPYAAYCGEPGGSRGGKYKWQKLGGDHGAIGDCRKVLELIHKMADTPMQGE